MKENCKDRCERGLFPNMAKKAAEFDNTFY
jgi:hypothetical protein